MPEIKRGANKFGIEHEIKPDKSQAKISDRALRRKAAHYSDQSDR